jgi:hypothetical protein
VNVQKVSVLHFYSGQKYFIKTNFPESAIFAEMKLCCSYSRVVEHFGQTFSIVLHRSSFVA